MSDQETASEVKDEAEETSSVLTEIVESAPADFVSLLENETRDAEEGVIPIRVIQPGWGSSGYYSEDLLKRSAQEGVFDGAHMNWDHVSQGERPERSLRNWAAVVVEGSTSYQQNGADGPGVYGRAYVFPHWRKSVESMRSHLGLSIVGQGRTKYGSAEGKQGVIFESLAIRDVDFVTRAGAGGKIVKQFNEMRGQNPSMPTESAEESEPEMPESTQGAVVTEAAIAEALKRNNEQWEQRFARLEEAQRVSEAQTRARAVVERSNLPQPAKERVASMLSADARLISEGVDIEKAANDAVEAELRYIEQFTPVHLRRPTLEAAMDDDKYETALAAAEAAIFADEDGDEDEE